MIEAQIEPPSAMIEPMTGTQEQATGVTIQRVGIAELPRLASCAMEFAGSSKFIVGFEMDRFCEVWKGLLDCGSGVIFSLVDANESIVGMIGGLSHKDIYSGAQIASEFFWFVQDGHRGHGLDLYRAFEAWAREMGCARIRMVHLTDSMPKKLESVYRRLGFEATEVHFTKELE